MFSVATQHLVLNVPLEENKSKSTVTRAFSDEILILVFVFVWWFQSFVYRGQNQFSLQEHLRDRLLSSYKVEHNKFTSRKFCNKKSPSEVDVTKRG